MSDQSTSIAALVSTIDQSTPVLIAGPTASGKSALALAIAKEKGGVIVNADAIQVFDDWRILTARPSDQDERQARHLLYGHVSGAHPYSVGEWLRDVAPLLEQERPIIVGGTGLYFTALTEGLAEIPAIDPGIRAEGMALLDDAGLPSLINALDAETRDRIDTQNPARVLRAWEVLKGTGKSISNWQDNTPPPLLPIDATVPIVFDAPKEWLSPRIEKRFRQMIDMGALDEARRNHSSWRSDLPSAKAIGAGELMSYLDGTMSLEQATDRATILTRQFAKRQRTWFRARMSHWQRFSPSQAHQ